MNYALSAGFLAELDESGIAAIGIGSPFRIRVYVDIARYVTFIFSNQSNRFSLCRQIALARASPPFKLVRKKASPA